MDDGAAAGMNAKKRPIRRWGAICAQTVRDARGFLQRALHLAATQATGAHVHVANSAANVHANALGVRQPNAVALAVGVADIVAAHRALLADLTNLSHNHTSFWCVNSHNTIIVAPRPRFDKCFFYFRPSKFQKNRGRLVFFHGNGICGACFFPESL